MKRSSAALFTSAALLVSQQAMANPDAGWGFLGFQDSGHLNSVMFDHRYEEIEELSVTPSGDWVLVAKSDAGTRTVEHSAGFPSSPLYWINRKVNEGKPIEAFAMHPDGRWMLAVGESVVRVSSSDPLWTSLYNRIRFYQTHGIPVDDLAFDPDGDGYAVVANGSVEQVRLPDDVRRAIADSAWADRDVRTLAFAPDGRWVLVADDWHAGTGIPTGLENRFDAWHLSGRAFEHVILSPNTSGFVVTSPGFVAPNPSDPFQAMEYDILDTNGANPQNIYQRMEDLRVTGLSIAVVQNGEITASRGYGVLEEGTERWVGADSMFDTASVSKSIAAAVASTIVDDGLVTLDESVRSLSASSRVYSGNPLTEWVDWGNNHLSGTVPYSLRLRHLLSHTAALTPHGSRAIPEGAPLPTTYQMLRGYQCALSSSPWFCGTSSSRTSWFDYDPDDDPDTPPVYVGGGYKYSGGGFLVAQALMEAVTNESYDDLVMDRIFRRLSMVDSTTRLPLHADYLPRIMVQHGNDGMPKSVQSSYPWATAGGVYASSRDLARFLLMMINGGRNSRGTQIVSEAMVDEMLTQQNNAGVYGLGWYVSSSPINPVSDLRARGASHGGVHTNVRTFIAFRRDLNEAIVLLASGGRPDGCPDSDEATWTQASCVNTSCELDPCDDWGCVDPTTVNTSGSYWTRVPYGCIRANDTCRERNCTDSQTNAGGAKTLVRELYSRFTDIQGW